jgi:ribonuclease HI
MRFTIYTDGACQGNPGPGGWGVYIEANGQSTCLSGYAEKTTNNRMELQAVIEGLKHWQGQGAATVITDSKYVKDGITQWIHRWLKQGWQTAAKKPVKNQDLWQQLHALSQSDQLSWQWVKGHGDCQGNCRADELARQAILERS